MVGVSVGPTEILIVLGIVILLFGAKKLPELARSVGRSSSEFKKGVQEGQTEAEAAEAAGTSDETEPRSDRKAETSE